MEGDRGAADPGCKTAYFNPLPPHGGRHKASKIFRKVIGISIHSLRMEGDAVPSLARAYLVFQSTPSAWRETAAVTEIVRLAMDFNPLPPHGGRPCFRFGISIDVFISIHSLRMEGDL